jgi:hypothetical protein
LRNSSAGSELSKATDLYDDTPKLELVFKDCQQDEGIITFKRCRYHPVGYASLPWLGGV